MIDELTPPFGRKAFPRPLALALIALLAPLALAACGRSSLRTLGSVGIDGGAGTSAGHAGSGVAGRIGTDGGRDTAPDGTDGRAGADGGAGVGAAGRDGGMDAKTAVAIVVAPSLITLPVGGQDAFTATLFYSDGTTSDATTSAMWTTSDPQVASVRVGRVVALRPGKTAITARVGALSASGTLVVMATISLVGLNIDPAMSGLPIGGSIQLTATGFYSDGSTADLTGMASWSSTDIGIATVDTGRVTAWKAGGTTIVAMVGGFATKAFVFVSPATVVALTVTPPFAMTGVGGAVRFLADATLSDGSHVDVTNSVIWGTDATVAVIDARGVATARAAGKAFVSATFGGQQGGATLIVTGATLKGLQVDPVDPTVGIGVSLAFHATGFYSDGSTGDLTAQVMWQSSAPGVVVLDGTGRAISKSVGTSVVSATTANFFASSTVTVIPAALKSIQVTPPDLTLMPGEPSRLRAIGTYADGTVVDVTDSVMWNAMISGIVAVSNAAGSAGVVTALAPGNTIVTASLGGAGGAAKVTVSPATLVSLLIDPQMAGIPAGATLPFTASGKFSDGSVRDVTDQVSWASSDDKTATVTNAGGGGRGGVATGVRANPNSVTITAFLGGIGAKALLLVTGAQLKYIIVAPADSTTTAGLRYAYTATGLYADNTKADVTTQVTWTTGDTNVATISNVVGAAGQLLARAAGMTTVSATLDGITGQTSVVVGGAAPVALSIQPIASQTPLGTPVQFTATLILSNGTTRNVTGQTQWSSSNPMAATISGNGRVVPVAPGATTISALYMGLSASTPLSVTDAVAVSIQVTPIAPAMQVGTVTQFTATAIFSDGSTRNVTNNATWLSSAPGVLGINAMRTRGRATAVSKGTAVVTASYMGLQGDTTVNVTDAVTVQISVSPVGATLPVGTRRQYTAQVIRSDGTSQNVTGQATWTSDAPMVAGVGTAGATRGQVTALSSGTANITATYMGASGSASVTVTDAVLTSIQVTPFGPTLSTGTMEAFVATALYSDGTSTPVTGLATWQSSDGAVAGVSNAGGTRGLVTTLMKGTTTISASYMAVTGSTTLAVTDATIVQIQVTPFDPTIPVGFPQQLTATAIYSDGMNRDITALATWSSTNSGVAGVSDALATKGLVTALAPGPTMINAQYAGVTGTADVMVTKVLLTRLDISPRGFVAGVGQVVPFKATGIFDDDSTLDLTTFVTWTSSDLDVADVSNADGSRGQASAFGPGVTTIQAQRGGVVAQTTLTIK